MYSIVHIYEHVKYTKSSNDLLLAWVLGLRHSPGNPCWVLMWVLTWSWTENKIAIRVIAIVQYNKDCYTWPWAEVKSSIWWTTVNCKRDSKLITCTPKDQKEVRCSITNHGPVVPFCKIVLNVMWTAQSENWMVNCTCTTKSYKLGCIIMSQTIRTYIWFLQVLLWGWVLGNPQASLFSLGMENQLWGTYAPIAVNKNSQHAARNNNQCTIQLPFASSFWCVSDGYKQEVKAVCTV